MRIAKSKFYKSLSVFFIVAVLAFAASAAGSTSNVQAQDPTPTSEVDAQIVGGQPATAGEWPWQVALIVSGSSNYWFGQFCGGSLIDPYWVVTAAHCVTENDGSVSPASSIDIVAGAYDLNDPSLYSNYQRRSLAQIIRHPNYNDGTLDNDIALLRLSTPVILVPNGNSATAAIPLASPSSGDFVGATAWVTGWGRNGPNPYNLPNELYEVSLPVISNTSCASWWGSQINQNNICAGTGIGKDACSGDSGGPLAVNVSGTWKLAGIVSAGTAACGDAPGIYTRVSQYYSWVNSYVFPQVLSITLQNATPTNASSIAFSVTFSGAVTGVDVSDFTLTTSGVSGASISTVNGSGSSYTVTVNTGSGDGTIRLDLVDNDTIVNTYSGRLGGTGLGNGSFTTGGVYTVDKIVPTVVSITRTSPNPTSAYNVGYSVTFSEAVIGVDTSDFTLVNSGLQAPALSGVSGSGSTWTVNVLTGLGGNGTLGLDFVNNGSVTDLATNPVSTGLSGEVYTINRPPLKAPLLLSPKQGLLTNNAAPGFFWQAVHEAQSYEIEFATDAGFTSGLVSDTTGGTSYTPVSSFSDGTYYWHVRAYDTGGQPGVWSLPRKFIVDTTGPSAPVLVAPGNGVTLPRTPMFKWQASSGAVMYELQYDTDAGFSNPIPYDVLVRGTSRRPGILSNGVYYWRMRARDVLGNWGLWSAPYTFTIGP